MNLPLRGVAIYNPALLSKEELIAQFIARRPLLETILTDLRKQDRPDHRILIGPRGMGKTTLLRRIHFAVEDDPVLSKRWMALPFPEEQYNLTRLSDFYLNCIDALGDALVHLGRTGEAEALDRLRDALPDGNEDVRADGALKLLLSTADRLGRKLILLIDNLEMVLDRLTAWEWNLRELLGHDARLCVIGASAYTPDQTYEYGKAFYEFFRIHELRPLNETEARQVLLHLADVRKAPQIARVVNEEPARVRTLLTLAGGNPRTLVQLYAVLAQSSEGDARSDLERLLDECTPIYKAKFEALSVQSQQIVDAVALHWHPVTVSDVGAITRLDPNVISSQVNRLFKEGLLEAVQAAEGNRKTYQIAERFFNIWYLMRASRRVRQRLIWLVESLRLIYGQDELPAHARHRLSATLPDGAGHRVRDAEYRMALAQAVEDKALRRALVSSALRPWADVDGVSDKTAELLELAPGDVEAKPIADRHKAMAGLRKTILKARVKMKGWDAEKFWQLLGGSDIPLRQKLAVVEKLETSSPKVIKARTAALGERERNLKKTLRCDVALVAYQRAIRDGHIEDMEDVDGTEGAALTLQCPELKTMAIAASLNRAETPPPGLLEELEKALEQTPTVSFGWLALAQALAAKSEDVNPSNDRVESAFRRALDNDPGYALPWRHYGVWLLRRGGADRRPMAEAALRKATELAPEDADSWYWLGQAIFKVHGRHAEAERAFRRATDLDPEDAPSWRNLGVHLKEANGIEAERAIRRAIELEPEESLYWSDLGDVLEAHGRYPEAAEAYRRAATLDPPWEWAWLDLGDVLEEHLDKPEEAEAAYRSGVCAKDTDVRQHALWNLTWHRYVRGIIDAETERLAREMVSSGSDAGDTLLLASILVARGAWDESLRLARSVLPRAAAEEHVIWWGRIVTFFSEVVRAKGAAAAIQVLHDLGFAERWLPLHAALVAVRDGDRALQAFAPEVRRPAETLLAALTGREPAPPGDAASAEALPFAATAPVASPSPVPADDKVLSARRSPGPSGLDVASPSPAKALSANRSPGPSKLEVASSSPGPADDKALSVPHSGPSTLGATGRLPREAQVRPRDGRAARPRSGARKLSRTPAHKA